jgi:hypothetical protein
MMKQDYIKEALEIDKATDTDFWRKAVNKEMAKVKIAWKTNDGLVPQQAREGSRQSTGTDWAVSNKLDVILCLTSIWTSRERLDLLLEVIQPQHQVDDIFKCPIA